MVVTREIVPFDVNTCFSSENVHVSPCNGMLKGDSIPIEKHTSRNERLASRNYENSIQRVIHSDVSLTKVSGLTKFHCATEQNGGLHLNAF